MQDLKHRGQMFRIHVKAAWITGEKLEIEGLTRRKCWVRAHGSTLTTQDDDHNYVYQLHRPLYGMPSAARAWHHTMSSYLKSQRCTLVGFQQSMWTVVKEGHVILITAHIDDFVVIACADRRVLDEFRTDLFHRFEGKYEGEVHNV
jgi:hypothetical protein